MCPHILVWKGTFALRSVLPTKEYFKNFRDVRYDSKAMGLGMQMGKCTK